MDQRITYINYTDNILSQQHKQDRLEDQFSLPACLVTISYQSALRAGVASGMAQVEQTRADLRLLCPIVFLAEGDLAVVLRDRFDSHTESGRDVRLVINCIIIKFCHLRKKNADNIHVYLNSD